MQLRNRALSFMANLTCPQESDSTKGRTEASFDGADHSHASRGGRETGQRPDDLNVPEKQTELDQIRLNDVSKARHRPEFKDCTWTYDFMHARTRGFRKRDGINAVRLPPRSPNLNAFAERYVRTINECCLSRMIFFGEHSLRTAIDEFVQHYHQERNHQGLDNRLIDPSENVGLDNGPIACRQRLGGLLQYYYRQAA